MTTPIQSEIASLKRSIERADREISSILREHGTGCRPSWVSGELAHLGERAERYRAGVTLLADIAHHGPITAAAIHSVSLSGVYATIATINNTAKQEKQND